jgi:transposase
MQRYTETIKESMVRKLTARGALSVAALSRETGIAQSTLYKWVQSYSKVSEMNTDNKKRSRSAEEKFEILLRTQGMSEQELGECLRKEGLHSADIERWKRDCLSAISSAGKGRPRKDPELVKLLRREEDLKRELRRKDKALAEASALLILKKKAEAIWGADEDEESD